MLGKVTEFSLNTYFIQRTLPAKMHWLINPPNILESQIHSINTSSHSFEKCVFSHYNKLLAE